MAGIDECGAPEIGAVEQCERGQEMTATAAREEMAVRVGERSCRAGTLVAVVGAQDRIELHRLHGRRGTVAGDVGEHQRPDVGAGVDEVGRCEGGQWHEVVVVAGRGFRRLPVHRVFESADRGFVRQQQSLHVGDAFDRLALARAFVAQRTRRQRAHDQVRGEVRAHEQCLPVERVERVHVVAAEREPVAHLAAVRDRKAEHGRRRVQCLRERRIRERSIDMGGATSSTSKVVIIAKATVPDHDVDYLYGQVPIDGDFIDWSGNCGNLSSAVGPFAIANGFLDPARVPRDGSCTVRIWQANIGKTIVAHVPMTNGEVQETGDFELDGVTFPAAEIALEFLDPADEGEDGGAMFPTGNLVDELAVPGAGTFKATMINAGVPVVFVDAAALGYDGTELQPAINDDKAMVALWKNRAED